MPILVCRHQTGNSQPVVLQHSVVPVRSDHSLQAPCSRQWSTLPAGDSESDDEITALRQQAPARRKAIPPPPALPPADQAAASSGADQEAPGRLASIVSQQVGMAPDAGQNGPQAGPESEQLGEPSGRLSAPASVVATATAAVNSAAAASSGALHPAAQHQAQHQPGYQPGSGDHPGGDVQLGEAQGQSGAASGGAAPTVAPGGAAPTASPVEPQQPSAATPPEESPEAAAASNGVDQAAQPGLDAQQRPAGQQEVATRESAFQQVNRAACSYGGLRLSGRRRDRQSGSFVGAQPNTPLRPCHKHLAWLIPAAGKHCQSCRPWQAWLELVSLFCG